MNRRELEDEYRVRLEKARARYDTANKLFDAAVSEVGHAPHPDGSLAVRLARIRASAAHKNYMRVLQAFNALIIYGMIPEDRQ